MSYKTVTDERGFMRPAYDEKLQQVDHLVADAEVAMSFCRQRRTCVQAGGAYGVWPLHLAAEFERVLTFEPDKQNFNCLVWNTRNAHNVVPMHAALGDHHGFVDVFRDDLERNNAGAGYTLQNTAAYVPLLQVDNLGLHTLDLLCLDVEGYELNALRGARETILRCQPVIMVEAKQLPHMAPGAAREAVQWLVERRGYTVAAEVHRDVVLVPGKKAL